MQCWLLQGGMANSTPAKDVYWEVVRKLEANSLSPLTFSAKFKAPQTGLPVDMDLERH